MLTYKQFVLSEGQQFKTPVEAYAYCLTTGKRNKRAEEIFLKDKDHYMLFDYAKNVVKGRWLEAEPEIFSQSPWQTLQYVQKVAKDRLPEAEDTLSNSQFWGDYLLFLQEKDIIDDGYRLVSLLKERGLDEETFNTLNDMEIPEDVQEWICQYRPDLINHIDHLDPKVKAKYRHETELGGVDL